MMSLANSSIVVAGGTGFLGTQVVRKLEDSEGEVKVISRANGVDLTSLQEAVDSLKAVKPDIVINCAAHQGGIGYQRGNEATVYLENLLMGTYLMEAARKIGVKKYVNVIAGCSYPGYLPDEVLDESKYWEGPLHESVLSYGFTKKAQVVQGWAYNRQFGFNSIHLILANMYGPGDHFDPERSHGLAALLAKMYVARLKGWPSVTVWGTGRPIREWLYVEDAAEAICLAARKYDEIDPLNIAVGSGLSIAELAEMTKRIVGFEGKLVYDSSKPDGAAKKVLGVRKMKEKLGWVPPTTLETGLAKTLLWMEQNKEQIIASWASS
jgi:GDP-L-fucose synthase